MKKFTIEQKKDSTPVRWDLPLGGNDNEFVQFGFKELRTGKYTNFIFTLNQNE